MNRIRDLVPCGHPRLRAVDYDDEACCWMVVCADCAATLSLTQREWAAWARAHAPARPAALVVVGDEPAESGRAPRAR